MKKFSRKSDSKSTHPKKSLEDFNIILINLLKLISSHAIEQFVPNKNDSVEMSKFQFLVHEDWKKAQNVIIKEVLELTDEINEVKIKIKKLYSVRDRETAKSLEDSLDTLEFRKRQVLYAMNAIFWVVFKCEYHVVRRFFLNETINNITRSTLLQTLKVTDTFNKEPTKLALLCDLTTFMHVGDIILVDYENKINPISIIELKEGKINDKCADILNDVIETECMRKLYFELEDMDKSEKKQFKRMLNQQWRGLESTNVVNTGKGIDIGTGLGITISDDYYELNSYQNKILEMMKELDSGKNFSLSGSKDVLYLGLYKNSFWKNGVSKSVFSTWIKELSIEGPMLDYLSVFNSSLNRPPFTQLMPIDMIGKLVTGEYTLMMCLDLDSWVEKLIDKYGDKVCLETAKKSRQFTQKGLKFIEIKGRKLKVNTPDGGGIYVADGILSKIFFDFYCPIDVIRPLIKSEKQ